MSVRMVAIQSRARHCAENTQHRFKEVEASDGPELQVVRYNARSSLLQTSKAIAAGNCIPKGRRE